MSKANSKSRNRSRRRTQDARFRRTATTGTPAPEALRPADYEATNGTAPPSVTVQATTTVERPTITFVHYRNADDVHINGAFQQRYYHSERPAEGYGAREIVDALAAQTGACVVVDTDLQHLSI